MKPFRIYREGVNGMAELSIIAAHTVGDEYHTIDELYDHRAALFAALCNKYAREYDDDSIKIIPYKSLLHSDGTMFEGGYFIAGILTPVGQITYHMKVDKWWDKFIVDELPRAHQYDGHTPNDCIERLLSI